MMARSSVPICAALSLLRDPRNPESFAEGALDDAEDGPLAAEHLGGKFVRLTRRVVGEPGAAALFERLQRLKEEENLDWLS